MDDHHRIRKWLLLGATGLVSGLATLVIFHSIPMASGTATVAAVSLIVAKHLALLVAAGSPFAALFQSLKPRVRAYCPWAPEDKA